MVTQLGLRKETTRSAKTERWLEGERLIIRRMVRGDLEQMQRWRPFREPLSLTWNLYWESKAQMDHWLERRSQDPSYRMYTITLRDGRVIGRLSLRHIRPGESAVLGISLGADWVGQGYGTEAITVFAPYYFDVLGFRVLWLDVAATNQRAIRCYEKCGFVHAGSRYQPVDSGEDLSFLQKPEYAHLRQFFTRKWGRYWLLFHDMKLERDDLNGQEKAW